MLLRDVVSLPHRLLLAHDVAAYQSPVLVDQDCSVATLVDGGNGALGNAVSIVGIGKRIAGLLLHVIGNDTLVGNRCPEVLVPVYEHDIGLTLDTHAGIDLLHVALETFRLRMIYAETCRCLNPQVAVQHFLNADDVAVGQRRAVLRVALEILEGVAVEAVQSRRGSEPHVSSLVFQHAVNLTADEAVAGIKCLKQIYACSCQWQCQHED